MRVLVYNITYVGLVKVEGFSHILSNVINRFIPVQTTYDWSL